MNSYQQLCSITLALTDNGAENMNKKNLLHNFSSYEGLLKTEINKLGTGYNPEILEMF